VQSDSPDSGSFYVVLSLSSKAGCFLTGWVTVNVLRNTLPRGVGYSVSQLVSMT